MVRVLTQTRQRIDKFHRPEISQNIQKPLLDTLIDLLGRLQEYHNLRGLQSQKRRRSRKRGEIAEEKGKGLHPIQGIAEGVDMPVDHPEVSSQVGEAMELIQDDSTANSVPEILKHVKFGVNEVARLLESQISRIRQHLLDKRPMEDNGIPSLLVIFACRWDTNPPIILAHIPHLVAAANTLASTYHANFEEAHSIPEVKLVNLPKGSENPLAEAVGVRRISVIALSVCRFPPPHHNSLSNSFQSSAVLGTKLDGLLKMVPRIATPWLIPTTSRTALVPRLELMHVKHLKTTAPIDIRAAKRERLEARKAAKQRRKRPSKASGPQRELADMQMPTKS